jgi:hypothetical protein
MPMRNHDSRQPLAVAATLAATMLATLLLLLGVAGLIHVKTEPYPAPVMEALDAD